MALIMSRSPTHMCALTHSHNVALDLIHGKTHTQAEKDKNVAKAVEVSQKQHNQWISQRTPKKWIDVHNVSVWNKSCILIEAAVDACEETVSPTNPYTCLFFPS